MTVPAQPNLYGEIDLKLGPRQQLVHQHIREHGPLTDDEAGALIHERRGKHHRDQRCDWCASEGRDVLASLRRKGLLTRKRGSGLWVLKDSKDRRGVDYPVGSGSARQPLGPVSSPEDAGEPERPDEDLAFGDWVASLPESPA